jgi:hypothetical protein
MILTGKRGALSPAEAEKKKKLDSKATPTEQIGSNRDEAKRGYQPPQVAMGKWDGMEDDDDPWQEWSHCQRRARRWSIGPTPDTSPINTPPQEKRKHGQQEVPTPTGPNPAFIHKHTHPWFDVKNEGAFREELEVEILTINGNPFRGSLTPMKPSIVSTKKS